MDKDVLQRFRRRFNLVIILGATASGKTKLAVRLARKVEGEIISADSRQVYRGMDLGTGKDLSEYVQGGHPVPVHLINILEPNEEYSVFLFRELFHRSFQEIIARRRIPILVGGTGLYLDAVVRGYYLPEVPENHQLREEIETGTEMEDLRQRLLSVSPVVHNKTDLLERKRLIRAIEIAEFIRDHPNESGVAISITPFIIGIRCQRETLRRKITARLESRLQAGMINEVGRLHERGISWERIHSFGLEYRYIGRYLQGEISYQTMFELLNTRIHQYAKRQETWFRRMEKNRVRIHWIDAEDDAALTALFIDLPE